jgi:hypothetical protein
MSSQQSNNANYKIDLSPNYQPVVDNRLQVQSHYMLTSNLDLYIPRIRTGTTEDDIKEIFEKNRVGTVEYCDISLTRDKDSKKPQHFCAFVKLISWSNLSAACEDFARTKSIRLHLNRQTSEFWMILPNNNPIPRSHVNTSQLAAATDKLFEQTEKITEKADKFEDEMRATIAEMRQMMLFQQQKIERLELEVAFLQKDTVTVTTDAISELFEEEEMPLARTEPVHDEEKVEERDFDAEVDALLDLPLPMMRGVSCETQMPSLARNVSISYDKEDDCIFSIRQRRELSQQPQEQKTAPIVSIVTLSLPEIVAKNPERAIESRDFCGNC